MVPEKKGICKLEVEGAEDQEGKRHAWTPTQATIHLCDSLHMEWKMGCPLRPSQAL